MIIQNSKVMMASRREFSLYREQRESLRMWQDAPAENGGAGRDRVNLSPQAVQAAKEAGKTEPLKKEEPSGGLSEEMMSDMEMQLFKLLMEELFGWKIDVLNPSDLSKACACAEEEMGEIRQLAAEVEATQEGNSAPQRQGWGLVYNREETHLEEELTTFAAAGIIRTADGREIDFTVDLSMSRSFASHKQTEVRAGDALIDPLVLNFDGTAAQLTQTRFHFDLDVDGSQEEIAFVQPGSGLLALDRNNNGAVDDGSELFGPLSGDGFDELVSHDQDGNGWIDEGDAIFQRLRLWVRSEDGQDQLLALGEKGIGAIYLDRVNSEFSLKDSRNSLLGQIRQTGIYLRESGAAGVMQQLDLAV